MTIKKIADIIHEKTTCTSYAECMEIAKLILEKIEEEKNA